ncbi:MAG: hypothetical protein QM765_24725 [Myxococcales bacterium]
MAERLGSILLAKQLITPAQLDDALKVQVIYGGRLGTNLVELGYLDLDALAGALAEQMRFPAATAQEFDAVPEETLAFLKAEAAEKHLAFPLHVEGRKLVVAMATPTDFAAVDALGFATGLRIVPKVAPELRLSYYLEKRYGIARKTRYIRIMDEGPRRPRPPPQPVPGAALSEPSPLPRPVPSQLEAPGGLFAPLAAGQFLGADEDDESDGLERSSSGPTPAPAPPPGLPPRPSSPTGSFRSPVASTSAAPRPSSTSGTFRLPTAPSAAQPAPAGPPRRPTGSFPAVSAPAQATAPAVPAARPSSSSGTFRSPVARGAPPPAQEPPRRPSSPAAPAPQAPASPPLRPGSPSGSFPSPAAQASQPVPPGSPRRPSSPALPVVTAAPQAVPPAPARRPSSPSSPAATAAPAVLPVPARKPSSPSLPAVTAGPQAVPPVPARRPSSPDLPAAPAFAAPAQQPSVPPPATEDPLLEVILGEDAIVPGTPELADPTPIAAPSSAPSGDLATMSWDLPAAATPLFPPAPVSSPSPAPVAAAPFPTTPASSPVDSAPPSPAPAAAEPAPTALPEQPTALAAEAPSPMPVPEPAPAPIAASPAELPSPAEPTAPLPEPVPEPLPEPIDAAPAGLMALPEPPEDAPQDPEPPYRPAPGLMHVEELLMRATSRERIAEALLWFCEGRFSMAVLLTIHGSNADAWHTQGLSIDERKAASLSVDLGEPSLLKAASEAGRAILHEQPQSPLDKRLLAFLELHPRSHAAAVPIVVKGRIVNMLFGTRGTWPMRETISDELDRIAQLTARAYDRLLLKAKTIDT